MESTGAHVRCGLAASLLALWTVACAAGPPWPRVAVPVPVSAVPPGSVGRVAVDVEIAADGTVREARAVEGDLRSLWPEVEAAARRWRYPPASAAHRTRIWFRLLPAPGGDPGPRFRPPDQMEIHVPRVSG